MDKYSITDSSSSSSTSSSEDEMDDSFSPVSLFLFLSDLKLDNDEINYTPIGSIKSKKREFDLIADECDDIVEEIDQLESELRKKKKIHEKIQHEGLTLYENIESIKTYKISVNILGTIYYYTISGDDLIQDVVRSIAQAHNLDENFRLIYKTKSNPYVLRILSNIGTFGVFADMDWYYLHINPKTQTIQFLSTCV